MPRRLSRSPGPGRKEDGGRNSPTGVRRGTVADVRSMLKTTKICIEGFMELSANPQVEGRSTLMDSVKSIQRCKWERFWFVLDSVSNELKGYQKRPLSDQEPQVKSVPLDEVSQVAHSQKADVLTFCLRSAEGSNLAVFRCEDRSTLLWWLHGFQRRIFEQTKGMLRKIKRSEARAKPSTLGRAEGHVAFTQEPPNGAIPFAHHRAATVSVLTDLFHRQPVTPAAAVAASSSSSSSSSPSSSSSSASTAAAADAASTSAFVSISLPSAEFDWQLQFLVAPGAQQGRRKNMEDETILVPNLNLEHSLPVGKHGRLALFGVFDGHAGRECAEFARDFLVANLVANVRFLAGDVVGGLKETFLQTDAEFREWALENDNISGSTAIVCVVRDHAELFVANAGDCRCVLARGATAVELSRDHKPDRPDERQRVEQAGGWVETQEVLNIPKLYAMGLEHAELLETEQEELIGWVNVHKVCGALGMTRSLGDVLIKDRKEENFECAFEEGFRGELICADPEVVVEKLRADDRFVIIACDGLWDVFSSQEATDFVASELARGTSREEIPERMIVTAIQRGSLDNCSVVVLFL